MSIGPSRGDIWLADLDPTRGREQAGRRPTLIVSGDDFNAGPRRLVMLIPLTTAPRGFLWHVPVMPPEGGLRQPSLIMCEQLRAASIERLVVRWGAVASATLARVEERLRILLDL